MVRVYTRIDRRQKKKKEDPEIHNKRFFLYILRHSQIPVMMLFAVIFFLDINNALFSIDCSDLYID